MEHPAYGQVRQVTPFASVLLADNPSPMTLDGTNTWLLAAPGSTERIVIDPGPADSAHLRLAADQGPVPLVLLTHHHGDHTEGVQDFAARTGAAVRALDPELCADAKPLADGELIEAAGLSVRVLATPGHTADSVSFSVEHAGTAAVFSGDTILGRGTTVVVHPDGHLGAFLDSLRRLAEFPSPTVVLPGHGPELPDLRAVAEQYLDHRLRRLDQVRAVVREQGPQVTARQVVEVVYADTDPAVWTAAEWTVRAQLTHLAELGEL